MRNLLVLFFHLSPTLLTRFRPEHCDPVTNFTRYFIKDYGEVSGRANMMAEIHSRGPIACSIGATSLFEFNYTTGIYHEFSDLPSNHIVSVSGWGYDVESKLEYWIVRNSWGNAWFVPLGLQQKKVDCRGETGWFRVVTSLYLNGRGGKRPFLPLISLV